MDVGEGVGVGVVLEVLSVKKQKTYNNNILELHLIK